MSALGLFVVEAFLDAELNLPAVTAGAAVTEVFATAGAAG
jgi:hypothetical protein